MKGPYILPKPFEPIRLQAAGAPQAVTARVFHLDHHVPSLSDREPAVRSDIRASCFPGEVGSGVPN